jgi:hypothetical protein
VGRGGAWRAFGAGAVLLAAAGFSANKAAPAPLPTPLVLNDDGGYCYQYVSLEGGRLDFEPIPKTDESWVIIFHRAMMQELDVDWRDQNAYSGGQCWEVMPMLTGRPADSHGHDRDTGRRLERDDESGEIPARWGLLDNLILNRIARRRAYEV